MYHICVVVNLGLCQQSTVSFTRWF